MKIPGVLLLFFCALNTCFAQSTDDFIVNGSVKTIVINKKSLKNASDNQTETRHYDKAGKMIRKIEYGKIIKDYYYREAKEPVLSASYEIKQPAQKSYEVKQYDSRGKLVLNAGIEAGKISSLDTYTDQEQNTFTGENEIYSASRFKRTSLANMTFSKELVPFIWDKELSEGIDQANTSFSNPAETDKAEHTITWTIFEKGNPGNRIQIVYRHDDDKGYWSRYLNNKLYQERYISHKTDLSDFGHLYEYDKDGRLTSDTYGYFEKKVYIQRKELSYDTYGNIIKQRELAEKDKPSEINYAYEYDQHKNWIARVEKYEDGSGSRTTRKLEYYTSNDSSLSNDLSDASYVDLLAKATAQAKIAEQQYKTYLSSKGKPIAVAPVATSGWQVFLPAGQVLDTVSYGDLNKDGLEDVVIVFQPKKALQHQQNSTRELRILFKQEDGKYLLAAKSNLAVMPEGDGNTFFSGTLIKNGILIVEHEFLRGGCTRIYRYQHGGFYLIGASNTNGDASYTKTLEYNLSTGKYVSEYTNDDDAAKSVKKNGVYKLNPLPKIETYELFSIEVEGEMI